MTLLRDLSILWSLFHILILFMLLYRSRYPRKKTFLLTGLAMGPLIALNVVGLFFYGAEVMGKIFILTCTLPSLLFFWFVSKDKKGRFFFTFCVADTMALWIIVVTNVLDFYLGGERYILMLVGRLLLFPLLEWWAVRYLRKPYLELQESVAKGWGVFAGMTTLYYVLLAVNSNFPVVITKRSQELPAFILILVLMPMTYATIFAALYRQLLLYRKRQSERVLQEQKLSLESQLENQQRIRRMKHDMKGHTVTLAGLLAAGQVREAQEYLRGMETEMSALSGQFCANPYLNAVLVQYSGRLEELGAACRMNIQVGEEALPYMELCQILSNGLENACDALKRLGADTPKELGADIRKELGTDVLKGFEPDVPKRLGADAEKVPGTDIQKGSGAGGQKGEVTVQMKYNKGYLLIRIRNQCRDDLHVEKGTIPATDKEEHGHGFGLATVQEAAGRLGGEMLCYTENGNFVLDVMVPRQAFQAGAAQG